MKWVSRWYAGAGAVALMLSTGTAFGVESLPKVATEWTLLAGLSHDRLDGGRSPWQRQYIGIHAKNGRSSQYGLQLERIVRFGQADKTLALTVDRRLGDKVLAGVSASAANSPRFLPENSYAVHIGRELDKGWVVDIAYRQRNYAAMRVDMLVGTLEKYVGNFRVAYTLNRSRPTGAPAALAHVGHVNWYRDDDHSFGVTLSTGDEVETIDVGRILKTEVRGLAVSGRHRVRPRLQLNWWLGVHDQGDFYRRHYAGLGIAIRL